MKQAYLVWFGYYPTIPKVHRYTLALRADSLMVEAIEMTSTAGFTPQADKLPYVRAAIRKLDTVKILLMVLWETKSLTDKKYIVLSEKFSEVGRMLGGWHGKLLTKQNSPNQKSGEK